MVDSVQSANFITEKEAAAIREKIKKFADIHTRPSLNRKSYVDNRIRLIAKRYEKNSTIITTNMPFSKWGDFFGSATLANAVLDRLLHHSTIISIKGPSYRIKDVRSLIETQAAEE